MTNAIADRRRLWVVVASAVVLLVTAVLAVLAFAGWSASAFRRVEVVGTLKSQVVELEAVRQQLGHRRLPSDWDVGAYVSNHALDQVLGTLEGASLKVEDFPGVTFQLESLKVVPAVGATCVAIGLRAYRDDGPALSVGIDGTALLLLSAMQHDAETGADRAMFRLSMLEVIPRLQWRSLTVGGSGLLDEIVSSRAAERLAQGLVLGLPMRIPAQVPLSLDRSVRIENGASSYVIRMDMPPSRMDLSVALATPMATGEGIWLMGGERQELALPELTSLSNDPGELRRRVAALEHVIRTKLAADVRADAGTDAALWLSHRYAASAFQAFNALSPERRSISIRLEQASGPLLERSFNVLGQRATFTSRLKAGSATVQLGTIETHWIPDQGLRASMPVQVSAQADVESQVQPSRLLGGSRQVDASLTGAVSETVPVGLGVRTVSHQNYQALMVGPVMGCEQVGITLETAGKPSLGMRQNLPLADIPLAGVLLLDTAPRHLPRAMPASSRLAFVGAPAWITATWHDPRVQIGADGYLVSAGFSASLSDAAPVGMAREPVLADAFQQAWSVQTRPVCPPRPPMTLLMNGESVAESDDIAGVTRLVMGAGRR